MEFFHEEENAREYIKMAEGFDGRQLIEVLKEHLDPGSTILELGIGPGVDLEILKQTYTVTGSDYSQAFLDIYLNDHPEGDVLLLDAITIETERKFDCIYTNKVLQHLAREDLKVSIKRQKEVLNDGGILFHSFWKGDKEEFMKGIRFVYYEKEHLLALFKEDYEVLDIQIYEEMEKDDSIFIVLKKK